MAKATKKTITQTAPLDVNQWHLDDDSIIVDVQVNDTADVPIEHFQAFSDDVGMSVVKDLTIRVFDCGQLQPVPTQDDIRQAYKDLVKTDVIDATVVPFTDWYNSQTRSAMNANANVRIAETMQLRRIIERLLQEFVSVSETLTISGGTVVSSNGKRAVATPNVSATSSAVDGNVISAKGAGATLQVAIRTPKGETPIGWNGLPIPSYGESDSLRDALFQPCTLTDVQNGPINTVKGYSLLHEGNAFLSDSNLIDQLRRKSHPASGKLPDQWLTVGAQNLRVFELRDIPAHGDMAGNARWYEWCATIQVDLATWPNKANGKKASGSDRRPVNLATWQAFNLPEPKPLA